MSGREMIIGIATFAAGANILMLRNYSPWYQLAFLVFGAGAILLVLAIMDDFDRKSKRAEEDHQRRWERNTRIRNFIAKLQVGQEIKEIEDTEGYTIKKKKYPGKSNGVIEDITYEFGNGIDFKATFTTSDGVITNITTGEYM
jgi:hypothetical protein